MINFSVDTLLDDTDKVLKSLKDSEISILVGIPEENAKREEDNEINNAQLLYIHTNGSPVNNLPARPVIEPALTVQDNKDKLTYSLKRIINLLLDDKKEEALSLAERTGQRAVNFVKRWFVDPRNGWPANKPATVWRKLRTVTNDKARMTFFQKYLAGDPNIDTVLVDTAEMRNSITYIVEDKS